MPANALGLPHAAHIHCNNLGVAGQRRRRRSTACAAVDGRRAHFTHLQFHSYGERPDGGWRSGAREVIEYVNAHPEVSGDVGQVMFGPATTLTADAPVEYLLHKSSGRKWVNVDIELETGCGIVPYTYKEKAAVAALQWVVGLELFLLSADPWRLVLSTDHPNGGSFMAYPELIRLLMDRAYRDEQLKRVESEAAGRQRARRRPRARVHARTRSRSSRGPARRGCSVCATRGISASAPTPTSRSTSPTPDVAKMFATPRYVVKGGTLVVEEGQLRRAPAGRRLHVRPGFDRRASADDLRAYFDRLLDRAVRELPGAASCAMRAAVPHGERRLMEVRGVLIEDTFAEAFGMRAARIVITARNDRVGARGGAQAHRLRHVGHRAASARRRSSASSRRARRRTGVPAFGVLLFTMDTESLGKRLIERIGQTVLTCPTTNCFDGLPDAAGSPGVWAKRCAYSATVPGEQGDRRPALLARSRHGRRVPARRRRFGAAEGRRRRKLPHPGESADAHARGRGGGGDAIDGMPGVILPFPGGIVRSGSKVGSRRLQGHDRVHERRLLPDAAPAHQTRRCRTA